jgi:PE-PPE domain/PE family
MVNVSVQPEVVAEAAANLADINSKVGAASAAAAGSTTSMVAAAGDEVSAAVAEFFSAYGQEYQELLKPVAALQEQFAAALAAAGNAYANAEVAASRALFGSPAAGGATGAAGPPLPPLNGSSIGLFMGGSGLPIPTTGYITGVLNYVNQNFNVATANATALFTPEGFYPITGFKSLPLDVSVNQGVTILQSAINQQLASGAPSVTILGGSQSAIISSLVMQNIMSGNYPFPVPSTHQLGFTLLGDPMAPNGGLMARFAGLTLPSLGFNFYGATPPNTPYSTAIYTLEYDGFADFPQYPINFLSDLNAFFGMTFVHGTYPIVDPNALPPGQTLIELPGSATLPGGTGSTNYYMITQPLPLLTPLRYIPVIGNPIADLLQPDLSVLVNLGYGSTSQGWSPGPANVPTPFGLIPPVGPVTIANALAAGAQQGLGAFASDIGDIGAGIAGLPPPALPSLSSMAFDPTAGIPSLLAAAPTSGAAAIDGFIQALQTANTTIVNGISGGIANAYAALLPTADIANAMITTLPSYDANLFLDGVQQAVNGDLIGGLAYAFGAPVAADVGLYPLLGTFELFVLLGAL